MYSYLFLSISPPQCSYSGPLIMFQMKAVYKKMSEKKKNRIQNMKAEGVLEVCTLLWFD